MDVKFFQHMNMDTIYRNTIINLIFGYLGIIFYYTQLVVKFYILNIIHVLYLIIYIQHWTACLAPKLSPSPPPTAYNSKYDVSTKKRFSFSKLKMYDNNFIIFRLPIQKILLISHDTNVYNFSRNINCKNIFDMKLHFSRIYYFLWDLCNCTYVRFIIQSDQLTIFLEGFKNTVFWALGDLARN